MLIWILMISAFPLFIMTGLIFIWAIYYLNPRKKCKPLISTMELLLLLSVLLVLANQPYYVKYLLTTFLVQEEIRIILLLFLPNPLNQTLLMTFPKKLQCVAVAFHKILSML